MGKKHQIATVNPETLELRVTCLHPTMDGATDLECVKICGYGHGLTIKEMNENLLRKGSPYIKIDECKYCYNDNTLGILDDKPEILGFAIIWPHESEDGFYHLAKIPKEAIAEAIKNL